MYLRHFDWGELMRSLSWILVFSIFSYHVFAAVQRRPAVHKVVAVPPTLLCRNVVPVSTSLGQPQAGIPQKRFYQYDQIIIKAAQHHNIDPFFIKAILVIESGLNPVAVSGANARGIAQFMRTTAKTLGIANCHDPDASIWGCARLVKKLGDRFDGDMRLVAAAYNAGPQAIIRAGRELARMRRETQHYVPSVMTTWEKLCCHKKVHNNS